MDTSVINAAIQAAIKANGNNEITGPILQSTLLQIVAALNTGKNDTLVSGTDIKTINGESILTSGNLDVLTISPKIKVNDLDEASVVDGGAADVGAIFKDANGVALTEAEILKICAGGYGMLDIDDTDTDDGEIVQRLCPLVCSSRVYGDDVYTGIYRATNYTIEFSYDDAAGGMYNVTISPIV